MENPMAFRKTAKALVQHPGIHAPQWAQWRQQLQRQGHTRVASSLNLADQASEILGERFDPSKYILSHATIVASVDTEEVPNVKLGSVEEVGQTITRKFADYHVTAESEPYINNNCFVPGTLVTMVDGTVKVIEEVRVGDQVLTHLGRSRVVLRTMSRQIDEEILEIKPRGTTDRIYATGEHPFFVFRRNMCPACGKPCCAEAKYNTRCVTHLIGKFYCSRACWYKHKAPVAELLALKRGEFVEAKSLTTSDFVATPQVREEVSIPMSLAQARLVGLFAAEGYYNLHEQSPKGYERVGVSWAFHEDERETLAKMVCELMQQEFGVECFIRTHSGDRGIHVTTNTNRSMVEFFSTWVKGKGSTTKYLHGDLLRASSLLQLEILRGWYEGDGCFHTVPVGKNLDGRITATSASRSLANQMKMMLDRLGIASHLTREECEGRSRLIIEGEVQIVNDPKKPPTVSWTVACGLASVGELVQTTKHEAAHDALMEIKGSVQMPAALRFVNGYRLQIIEKIRKIDYTGPVYNLEVEEDNSYLVNDVAVHNCDSFPRDVLLKSYRTFVGGDSYLEHVQVKELSKGRILDAVARDIGPSVYVDILVANHRKHTELCERILSGKLNTLSMGCSTVSTTCTKCGNVAADEVNLCTHIRYEKGNYFYDPRGQRRKVAEICGHASYGDTGGVNFIEASWVEVPAFTGAVMRNIIEPAKLSPKSLKQMKAVLESPPKEWVKDEPQKTAFMMPNQVGEIPPQEGHVVARVPKRPGVTVSASGEIYTHAHLEELQARVAHLQRLAEEFDFGGDDEPAEEEAPAEEAPAEDGLGDLVKETESEVLKRVKKQIKEKITPKPIEPSVEEGSPSTSNNIIKDGARQYMAGLGAIVAISKTSHELLDNVFRYHEACGRPISKRLYRAASQAVAFPQHPFSKACVRALGRKPTEGDLKTIIRLGHLLALRSRTAGISHVP